MGSCPFVLSCTAVAGALEPKELASECAESALENSMDHGENAAVFCDIVYTPCLHGG